MRRIGLLAVGCALVGGGAAWVVAQDTPAKAAVAPAASPVEPRSFDMRRFVFFAVLEGCYTDGVRNDDLVHILMANAQGQPIHFVPRCPLCMPALDAFRLYAKRPPLEANYKGEPSDRFRHSMEGHLVKRLREDVLKARLDAIHTLIARWVQRRITMLRPTTAERRAWTRQLQERSKKGMALLRIWARRGEAGDYSRLDECAICNACVTGAVKPR